MVPPFGSFPGERKVAVLKITYIAVTSEVAVILLVLSKYGISFNNGSLGSLTKTSASPFRKIGSYPLPCDWGKKTTGCPKLNNYFTEHSETLIDWSFQKKG